MLSGKLCTISKNPSWDELDLIWKLDSGSGQAIALRPCCVLRLSRPSECRRRQRFSGIWQVRLIDHQQSVNCYRISEIAPGYVCESSNLVLDTNFS